MLPFMGGYARLPWEMLGVVCYQPGFMYPGTTFEDKVERVYHVHLRIGGLV